MNYLVFVLVVYVSSEVRGDGECRLSPHPSVEYRCLLEGGARGTRACDVLEPAGTVVRPRCRGPNYYSTSPLELMHCFHGGYWDHVARCIPECGRVTPGGQSLVVGGQRVKRGEIPWHAGIYRTTTRPYEQICGGSIISSKIVISVAHCFSNGKEKLPASQFAVAVGKVFRPWDDPMDMAQKSQVKVIHIPEHYQGASANFQEDIAILIVAKEFTFETHIRPVCLSYDVLFEVQQLYTGVIGKVAGWGLTAADGKASPVLQVLDMPYVDVRTCIKNSREDYREFITGDKICAGTLQPTTALCKGDSGGGLAFAEEIHGVKRYYLRGLVSSSPSSLDGHQCNTETYTSFTSTLKHEHFIKQFLIELGEFRCQDGSYINTVSHCDGTRDCGDGSDETAAACSQKTCPAYMFRCKYGACIDKGAICDGVPDCADSSDEAVKLCEKGAGAVYIESVTSMIENKQPLPSSTGRKCEPLPKDTSQKTLDNYEYSIQTGHWYKFHLQVANWTNAKATCSGEGARLAVPNSVEEAKAITAMHARYLDSEIPGTDWPDWVIVGIYWKINAWVTVDGQSLAESGYEKWLEGWPEDPISPYVVMDRGGRYSNTLKAVYPFVCEKPSCEEQLGYECSIQTGHWYKFHPKVATWTAGRSICQEEESSLAVPNSKEEARVLTSMQGRYLDAEILDTEWPNWMSVGIYKESDVWVTTDGEPLSEAGYEVWLDSWPRGLDPYIVMDRGGRFSNTHSQQYPFICEKATGYNCSERVLNGGAKLAVGIITPAGLDYEYSNQTGHWYKFHPKIVTWSTGKTICEKEGARLAVPNSLEEAKIITSMHGKYLDKDLPGTNFPHWVSVGIYKESGAWVTVDGQSLSKAGYQRWLAGWPSGTDPYVVMNRGGKYSNTRNDRYPFICEKASA